MGSTLFIDTFIHITLYFYYNYGGQVKNYHTLEATLLIHEKKCNRLLEQYRRHKNKIFVSFCDILDFFWFSPMVPNKRWVYKLNETAAVPEVSDPVPNDKIFPC